MDSQSALGNCPLGRATAERGWSRAVNENTRSVLRRNFWKEVRKCEKINFNQELIEEKTKMQNPTGMLLYQSNYLGKPKLLH